MFAVPLNIFQTPQQICIKKMFLILGCAEEKKMKCRAGWLKGIKCGGDSKCEKNVYEGIPERTNDGRKKVGKENT